MEGRGAEETENTSLPRDFSSNNMLENSSEQLDFEMVLPKIGGFGRQQHLLVVLTWLPNIFIAFNLFSDIFFTLTPDHHCRVTRTELPDFLVNATEEELLNATIPLERDDNGEWVRSQCNKFHYTNISLKENIKCTDGWDFLNFQALDTNMVTQWNLVCDNYWEVPVEEVCFIIGFLTGYLFMGYAADRIGRKKTFILALILSILWGTLLLASSTPAVFILMRFFLGSSLAGLYLSLYIMRLELCDPPHRLMITMIAGFFTVGGQFLLLGLAVGCKDWRVLQGVIISPLALFLAYSCPQVLFESPRWLLASKQIPEAKAVLRSFVEKNSSGLGSEILDAEEILSELDTAYHYEGSMWHHSITKLLQSRNIWKNLLILGFTTFIGHGIHHCYGTFRKNVQGTKSGFYLSYLLSAGTGVLACLFLCFTVDRFGRRGILLLSMTMTGISSLVLLGLIEYLNEAAIMTFSILGLFSSHAAASLSVFFAAEVIPTVIRGEGLGIILALASLGKLSSPIMDLHNEHGYFLHHVVYASFAILCILSIMLLPESKRKALPESIKDGELYRRPSLLRRRRDHVPLLSTPNPTI
ncbi:solute carrier family 22 member 17-like isoform X2 [Protopterus annectens]|nr:solute carrier family 22 member 17-like isoform X2 [Protopterus annectens]XP_043914269.1 solute carrier family 22 member 17-like isoform X2 [Protopterus annectens]